MADTRERPANRLRCILIFNGPQLAGEAKIFLRAMEFFERLGFYVTTLSLTDNINELQEAISKAEGKSLCMQHLCREGEVISLKDWIDQTRELMLANRTHDNLPQAPEISATDDDPFDITQYM
ncbi:hypothetical protein CAPTEDRAFT_190597 [Capitella teleta]|uniref:Uncharacterized protein n=1 Tax=Capitella teleta TaxID=283909 RepID=R7UBK3_CAPTE|nr:hypothetical protein CAPTEDRAFT_190597 [Capitella teleta]|eukprot:ELU03364.1 hypothetical protein CAPTEDRAFT_190597 [Capitella teleta]